MPLPMLACCTQALRSYQLEGTRIAVIPRFCCVSLATFVVPARGTKVTCTLCIFNEHTVSHNLKHTAGITVT